MTLREVDYLSENVEFKHLVIKYNLILKVVDNQKIYLKSKCYIFEIYGLVVEDFFYFDLSNTVLMITSCYPLVKTTIATKYPQY